jgi:POT family proton-dependent oligopeptide transporter
MEYTLESIQNFKGKYPKQLWYLFLIEMWERFTFYGMRALLGLYISHLILSANYQPLPEKQKQEAIAAFETENKESLNTAHPQYYIKTSQQKYRDDAEVISNKRYGTIQAFIYAMAFVGGLFADKIFGFRKSIFWGGILMAIGTFMMAIPGSFAFYAGVSILIVGNGFFKPNISTMVGSLYKEGDPRRDAGFSLFYSGINIGALLSGLIIAYVGTSISWSLGFAIAGICMLIGLSIFVFTQRTLGPIGLPPAPEKLKVKVAGISRGIIIRLASLLFIPVFFALVYFPIDIPIGGDKVLSITDLIFLIAAILTTAYISYQIYKAEKQEAKKLIVASILILFSTLFWSFFEQGGGSLNFFANGNVKNTINMFGEKFSLNMTSVNNSINALWVVIFAPIIGLLWLFLNKKKKEPNTINKFGFGFIFLGIGFLMFFASKFFATPEGFTPIWIFMFAYLITTIGELCLSPIGLSMITKLSPQRLHGVMMGTWFLASAYGQYGAGLIGAALAKGDSSVENPSNFQKLLQYTSGYESIGYIAIGGGIVLIILSPFLKKMMGTVK